MTNRISRRGYNRSNRPRGIRHQRRLNDQRTRELAVLNRVYPLVRYTQWSYGTQRPKLRIRISPYKMKLARKYM